MTSTRNTALVATVAFLLGAGVGHWVIPGEEPNAQSGEDFHAAMQAASGPTSQPSDDGSNCTMEDCAADRSALEARLAVNPDDAIALLGLGSCDMDMGNMATGMGRVKRAAELSRQPAELVKAARLLARGGDAMAGLAALDKSLAIDPKNIDALYQGGLIAFHDGGDNALAISYWERYLEAAPDAANADLIKRSVEQLKQS